MNWYALFWAKIHPLSKFCGNWFSSFCIILLTNQPINQPRWVKTEGGSGIGMPPMQGQQNPKEDDIKPATTNGS